MAQDISGFGVVVTITASNTFPAGFVVTQFADNSDPLDFASVKIADTALGLNGDLIKWSRATTYPMVLNVIPGSIDDINLKILADANRVAAGHVSARDEIMATVVYPDGTAEYMLFGTMTDAMFGKSIGSDGRMKTKAYAFSFEDRGGNEVVL